MKHKRVESVLLILHRLNAEWTSKLLGGEWQALGNGLEVRMHHYLARASDGDPYDHLNFEFKLEGREVGSVDEGGGGFIHFSGVCGNDIENDDEVIDHMWKCLDRIDEIFPKFFKDQLADVRREGSGAWDEDPFESDEDEYMSDEDCPADE